MNNCWRLGEINRLLAELVENHQIGTWNAYFIMDRLLADFEEGDQYPDGIKFAGNDGSQCYVLRDDDNSAIFINGGEDL